MRVLHVVPSLDPSTGGPARSVPALCGALQAAGTNVSLYTFRRPGAPATVNNNDDGFLIDWYHPWSGTRQLPTGSFYRRLCREVNNVDLVHLHSIWNPAISAAALACRRAGAPYIVSVRGMLQTKALHRKRWLKEIYYRLCERYTLAGAHALHFFTQGEAADSRYVADGKVPFVVIPNGVDPDLAHGIQRGRFRSGYAPLQGKRIMLFLGRVHWSKGLELQLDTLALLLKDFPTLVWVLAGPDSGAWSRLWSLARRRGLEAHILWTGLLSRQRCLEALADADMFVLTSRHETHSMAMNEALAIGAPVIVTDTVHCDEVQRWGAGYVVHRDPQHLAAAIGDILRHPEKADRMREAGRQLVAERLAWPKVADAMVRVYEAILAGHGAGKWGHEAS